MWLLWTIVVATILVACFVLWVRPWMRKTPWGQDALARVEPVERWLYDKSETIFWARWLQFVGVLTAGLAALGELNVYQIVAFVPEKAQPYLLAAPPAAVFVNGLITSALRRDTTKPLEVVALPDDAPLAVQSAVARAEVATKDAVDAVTREA